MYESAFGFRMRPFAASPSVALYYPAATIEKARATLARCIEHGGGPGLIIGAAGMGKSLLCQLLAEQYRDQFRVVMLASARLCTRRALLQNILFELGLPYRDLEEGELRLSLIDFLANDERAAQGMLLIVDEAHSLPTRLLEEIRMITNLVRDGRPRVRLILAGSARLEERFASPKLESFNQRIAARCYLEPLGREETRAYITAQLTAAGRRPGEIFTPDALDAVFDATAGVPRLINQVCDHALVLAMVGGRGTIGAAGIEEAWSDLQQLPAPWHMDSPAAENVIEFGPLTQNAAAPQISAVVSEVERPDPIEQLSAIEHSVALAAREADPKLVSTFSTSDHEHDEDEQFRPAGVIGPEVELVFHASHSPFGDDFVEEEVVIDRYAALESARLAKLRQTPWSRDRAIPEQLAEAQSQVKSGEQHAAAIHETPAVAAEASNDPVYPEYRVAIPDTPHVIPAAASAAPEVVEESPVSVPIESFDEVEDDRDLIVIEDDVEPSPTAPAPHLGRVRRQEYRQLFARMRRG